MTERIHDDEPDTGEPIVRALLEAECPQWAQAPLRYLSTSGTDNAMWRVLIANGTDLVVRLPRRPGAAAGVTNELTALDAIPQSRVGSFVKTPVVAHRGQPHPLFPYRWSVLQWIEGQDAWTARDSIDDRARESLAADLGQVVLHIAEIEHVDVPDRLAGSRGGPLGPLLDRLTGWLEDPAWDADGLIDVAAVKRLVAESREVIDEPVSKRFVHGDLIPGNLLVQDGRLVALIDWGGAGIGDAAQDLAPAWSVLTAVERPVFREATGADDSAWLRGRAFELEHAVGGVLYYVPRSHELGQVMTTTLQRILTDS